jgi:hypothetical protein
MPMRLFALALALLLSAPARAEEAALPAAGADAADARAAGLPLPETAAPAPRARGRGLSRFGLLADLGFPEGAAASVVYRPVPQIRLFAGPAWSYVAWGAQAGVTVIPWHLGISPVISLEGGRYFAPDASFLARNSSGIPEELEPLLHDVTYDYAALHVGLEIGTRNAIAISLRAGLSRVWFDTHGSATVTDATTGTTVTFTDPSLRGTLPSVKLGLQLWF